MILKTLLIAIFPSLLLANTDLLQECIDNGRDYGNGNSEVKASSQCFDEIEKHTTQNNQFENKDKNLKIVAYRNLLYVKHHSKITLISGEKSQLRNIKSISFDNNAGNILVHDNEQGAIFTFPYARTGNVAPIFRLIGDKYNLVFASKITFDNVSNLIIVSFESGEIYYNAKANVDSRRAENSTLPVVPASK